ncbi:MAG: hypothetical protein RBR57_00865 [Candidatus Syntrophosphaera sp.]|jgi:hypothetical protein|nr:hypothetical protein [Candidatus Cloacimonadota bacterium]MDY0111456.1 hypothetical protein [Candidatus Syntrophosphaera sp.]
MYFNLENNLSQSSDFEILFPEIKSTHLDNSHYDISLTAGERKTILLIFTFDSATLYSPKVKITANPDSGKLIDFEKQIFARLMETDASTKAIIPFGFYLLNGLYYLIYNQKEQKKWGYFRFNDQ